MHHASFKKVALFIIISFFISSNLFYDAKQKPNNEWYSISGVVYEFVDNNGGRKFTCSQLLNAKFLKIAEPAVNDLDSCLNKCPRSYSIFASGSTETVIDKFQNCCLPRCKCNCLLKYGIKESKYKDYKTCKLTDYAVENCPIQADIKSLVEILYFKPKIPPPPHDDIKALKKAPKDKDSEEIDAEQNLNADEQEDDFQGDTFYDQWNQQ